MKKLNHIVVNENLTHFHDDYYSDGDIVWNSFPYDKLFGDFRIFNGLPLEVVDSFVREIRDLMYEIELSHLVVNAQKKKEENLS